MLKDTIIQLSHSLHQRVVSVRRHLHMHPELSFEEQKTSEYVGKVLTELGIPFTGGWAGHGIVAVLECQNAESAVVALRADMDALPIQETNNVPYKSQVPGVMHACGHDVHTASLLGVAMTLAELRTRINGTFKFIFQPGEERLPGGASMMIQEGALRDPDPSAILGQHVHPMLPAGHVGFRPGSFMGSSDEITIRIQGKGGHGAMPHQCIDPVVISAHVITALQSLVSRFADPLMPTVLTFGKVRTSSEAFNIIPDFVDLQGTLRTFDEDWRKRAKEKIREIVHGICNGFGAQAQVNIDTGYPVLQNDHALTARCKEAATELLGGAHVHELPQRLTSEDFAYYTHQLPGCFYRLGTGNPHGEAVHTSTFDIDEAALQTGVAVMTWLAITEASKA